MYIQLKPVTKKQKDRKKMSKLKRAVSASLNRGKQNLSASVLYRQIMGSEVQDKQNKVEQLRQDLTNQRRVTAESHRNLQACHSEHQNTVRVLQNTEKIDPAYIEYTTREVSLLNKIRDFQRKCEEAFENEKHVFDALTHALHAYYESDRAYYARTRVLSYYYYSIYTCIGLFAGYAWHVRRSRMQADSIAARVHEDLNPSLIQLNDRMQEFNAEIRLIQHTQSETHKQEHKEIVLETETEEVVEEEEEEEKTDTTEKFWFAAGTSVSTALLTVLFTSVFGSYGNPNSS